jgi:2,4-dienoyl-CoA reductase-like NADH-dependent reductase (Old Yellow Enzyme family)
MSDATVASLSQLREALVTAAREAGQAEPVVGLQLTHSGRWSRPEGPQRPRIAYRHPLLDRRGHVAGDACVLSDGELDELVEDYARAALLTHQAGYAFADIKHCHGYLLHEFLSARSRAGRFGGEKLETRAALSRTILEAVRKAAPDLRLGVRLSLFDHLPHVAGEDGRGAPEAHAGSYPYGFGLDADHPERIDLTEPIDFARCLESMGVDWLNVTAASPYYAPHLQRPALFPPSDGYDPPEDPLIGVARLLGAARDLKQALPGMTVVSSGWSYLQEFVPHVAQACVREGWFDAVGLGRMALSYPTFPADVLSGRALSRRSICRTFSDCTTAPRNGLVSGCYPLDPFYRDRPEREVLESIKRGSP